MSHRGVQTTTLVRGTTAGPAPTHLVEVPHGATRTAQHEALRRRLREPGPADLVDFFHVNTDAGAPELALAVARDLVRRTPSACVAVLVAEIPRTFIDVNRVIDVDPAAFREGKVTPGVPPWIRDPGDLRLLRGLHQAYVAEATRLVDAVEGRALLLHTYAPRSVDVEVDIGIAAAMRRAWDPEVAPTWPLRPEVDVIGRALDGTPMVPEAVLTRLVADYAALGITVADGRTYPLHPSTQAFHHAARWPGRTLCVEVRRDLICRWDPFAAMTADEDAVARFAGPLATALLR